MNTVDQLNFCNESEAQRAAFACINGLQDFNAGQQVGGAALLFLLLCERFNVKPNDMLVKGRAILLDSLTGVGEHSRTIKTYLHKEL